MYAVELIKKHYFFHFWELNVIFTKKFVKNIAKFFVANFFAMAFLSDRLHFAVCFLSIQYVK